MSSPPPERLDPWRAVELGAHYGGRLPLSGLSRLRDNLLDASGEVEFALDFGRDEGGRARITGVIGADLTLCCQRCLGAMAYRVDAAVSLALVRGEDEARALPEECDPLLVTEERIRLADLIEDELLLQLPQIPMHAPAECSARAAEPERERDEEARVNPFAVLADWKREP